MNASSRNVVSKISQCKNFSEEKSIFSLYFLTIHNWFRNSFLFAGCQVWGRTKKGGKVRPVEEWTLTKDNHQATISFEQAEQIFKQGVNAKRLRIRSKRKVSTLAISTL